jgi:hypothetical protein
LAAGLDRGGAQKPYPMAQQLTGRRPGKAAGKQSSFDK